MQMQRPDTSLSFFQKGLNNEGEGEVVDKICSFRRKGKGREIFADIFFFFFFLFEKERERERGNWRLPTTTTSRGWEHPGQRWMGLYRKPGFFFLLRDPPANGSHLSDRVDLGWGAWKIQGEEISNF